MLANCSALARLLMGAAAPSCLLAAPAIAQQSALTDEIIVFSQKRAESIQDVPVSVSAITAEQLNNTYTVDLTDVGFQAPNVQLQGVSTFPGFANFTVRGIGVSTSIRTLDPAVNIFVDGMVLGTQIGAVLDVFDVEAVEILRGPQGILFGRNSTGGAVLLRTAKPTEEFAASVQLAAGAFNLREAEAIVQGPIAGDALRAKLAVQVRKQDGMFVDNNEGAFVPAQFNPTGLQPANPAVDQAEQDSIFIKPTVTFEPNDSFDITLFGQYFFDTGGGAATQMIVEPGAPSTTETLFGYTPPDGQFNINHDLPGDSETRMWHVIGEANLDLGHGVVTSITAWRDVSFDSSLDVDGTPFPLIHFPNNEEEADQFTQEIRYTSEFSDQFDFIIGGFFMDSQMAVIERREFSGLTAGRAPEEFNFIQSDWVQDQRSAAGFFNGRYHLTDALSVSAGVRFTWEEKKLNITPLTPCAGPGFTNCATDKLNLEESWTNASPRAGVELDLGEDAFTYFNWTRGFRSGNFNARAPNEVTIGPADPEQADQFEVGLKGLFLNGTLRANVAGFFTIYDDIQRVTNTQTAGGEPLQLLRNAARANIKGVEAEFTWNPVEPLVLESNFGWIDPQFKEFTGLDINSDGVVTPEEEIAARNLEFDRVPNYTVFAAANYTFNLPDMPGDFTYRAQYSWRDGFPTDVRNLENRRQDSFGLLDMSVRYETDRVRVAVFGRNITETNYVDIISAAFNTQGFGGMARTWGIEAGVNF